MFEAIRAIVRTLDYGLQALEKAIDDESDRQANDKLRMANEFNELRRELAEANRQLAHFRDNSNGWKPMNTDNGDFRELLALYMKEYPDNKIRAIKAVRSMTGLGLRESKDYVESLPQFNPSWKNEDDEGFSMEPIHE